MFQVGSVRQEISLELVPLKVEGFQFSKRANTTMGDTTNQEIIRQVNGFWSEKDVG